MEEEYNFKEAEQSMSRLWEKGEYFTPRIHRSKRPYSMFLTPPNASGPMHVGNALMIAIQDVLARYYRAKGEPTLWIPGTDHGGYETQVTYEREMGETFEQEKSKGRTVLFKAIEAFVERNNETIKRQIKALGASVDWSRFRYTLDAASLLSVDRMFKKMIADGLVYRNSYMVHYCTVCATVLADIELKEVQVESPLYHITFPFKNTDGHLTLTTTRPEFLFAATHVLVLPSDKRFAQYIGESLVNPVTAEEVLIVASKRKFDPAEIEPHLAVFSPSFKKYDFEYAIRNGIPVRDLLDWEGTLIEQYPGKTREEARQLALEHLTKSNSIEKVDESYVDTFHLCKKGHPVQSIIRMTWFLRLDDEKVPLRKPALEALKSGSFTVMPFWRKKGLTDWLGKMHDWPIARQNIWGITIPLWYEVSDPSQFTVWFLSKDGVRRFGNLQVFLDEGISFEEITQGLERIYAAEGCAWTLTREAGKTYLPETDTFDTWFSSSAWSTIVFGPETSEDFSYFYPSHTVVIGHDLLRLSIARKILFGVYLTGKLPFKRVYFHQLLKSSDGQKMSKSLGNAVSLDHFLEKFGADVTRMTLLSYTGSKEDFVFSEETLEFFKLFSGRLWRMGRISDTANIYSIGPYAPARLSKEDTQLLSDIASLRGKIGLDVEKCQLSDAQEKLVSFLKRFEEHTDAMHSRDDAEQAVAVFNAAFKEFISILHPFMPFMTESLQVSIYKNSKPLAAFAN